ncbi:putative baseplate assembly protein [Horticoccus sp. 23ND18S-11]|uniref:putative baseplate assembly protein n=1 Tax=Horticoccus sp. 23ND18S-11 TaxID=3391832 RepID=UPI0039C8E8D9
MPIRVPSLDDRSYQQLVEELLARIPAHTPEWTNPVPGDPGRTLVELFAWLTDTLLYRVNLIPERQRLAFLRLLGVQLRAARSARTVVSIGFDAPDNHAAQLLPALTRIKGPVLFETRDTVTVLPLVGETYCKRPLSPVEHEAMSDKIAQLSRLYPVSHAAVPYLTTPVFPDGKADPDGFDLVQQTVDHSLWYALLVPLEQGEPPAFLAALDAVKTTLGQSASGGPQYLNLAFAPKLTLPAFGEDIGERSPIPCTWELTTPDPADPKGVAFLPLTVVSDTTQGLTTDGIVRLSLPAKASFFAPPNNVRQDVDAGTGDKPPRLDDAVKSQRLVAWLRLRPAIAVDSLALTWTGINGAEVDQRQTTAGLVVGQGTGQPDQTLALPNGGIEAESFSLQVEEAGLGYRRWRRVDDLLLAGVQEAAYSLDPEAGTVRFGDGVRGKIPARGARFRVERMRLGGGEAGNVAPGSLVQVQVSPAPIAKLKVLQPLAAAGGQEAETLAEAEKRIPALFRNRDRAVTADDYEQLALTTPGVRVGRVEVLPRFKPQERRSDVPGVVSVMALPYRASFDAPYPRVDRPFIETVFKRLADRKPLGTELYVIGCEYVPIAISVGIDNPGGREETATAVKDALKKYLFCLPPGGPQARGWPLGRTVKRRELEIIVSRVEAVTGVYGPNLFRQVNGAWERVTATSGNENAEITLLPWQLPELIGVVVAAGEAPTEFKPPAPNQAKDGFAIPVVPEVC